MAAKVKYDWEAIKTSYRTGLFSDSELCRQHSCSRGALQSRIKSEGWTKDLTTAVNQATRAALITEDASKQAIKQAGNQAEANKRDKNEVELAAQTRVELVREHRRDIAALQNLEQRLIAELGNTEAPPEKLHISNYQGSITKTLVGIPVTERASALQSLAGVQHKRIQLERQAFNLDDDAASLNDVVKMDPIEAAARITSLLRIAEKRKLDAEP